MSAVAEGHDEEDPARCAWCEDAPDTLMEVALEGEEEGRFFCSTECFLASL